MINDNERIQRPMIRVGDRGQGNWKPIGWDEALDYVADRLKSVIDTHGGSRIWTCWPDSSSPIHLNGPNRKPAFQPYKSSLNAGSPRTSCPSNLIKAPVHPGVSSGMFGRCGVHTQGHTVNNSLLFEQVSENTLWINTQAGANLGLSDGDMAMQENYVSVSWCWK